MQALAETTQQPTNLSIEQIDLIKNTIFKGSTNDELQMFVQVCNRTKLDPFARQIYATKRWDNKAGKETLSFQTSIDGFRLIAERSGKYEGQTLPVYCGPDGVWKEIWSDTAKPFAAKVGVYRRDFREPVWAIAKFESYVQTTKDGKPNSIWAKMPELMISKCAEALALRKAFPQELSGLYTADEMGQMDVAIEPATHETPTPAIAPKQAQPTPTPQPEAKEEKPVDATPPFDPAEDYKKLLDHLVKVAKDGNVVNRSKALAKANAILDGRKELYANADKLDLYETAKKEIQKLTVNPGESIEDEDEDIPF